ncbi:DUF2929 family protein [Sporosarcina sp. 179-K 3D1 HS]|uniref:DUF2929 family protein n=1 Tax=Sporosarcina sp. 179-K 3D1 HS TaxID=3232169 RepID=UPI0039A13FA9
MKIVMTFLWSFLLVTMLNYVTGSIAAVPFDLVPGIVISVILAVVVLVISSLCPDEPVADH